VGDGAAFFTRAARKSATSRGFVCTQISSIDHGEFDARASIPPCPIHVENQCTLQSRVPEALSRASSNSVSAALPHGRSVALQLAAARCSNNRFTGTMINTAQSAAVLQQMPWLWVPAGVLIALAVLSINFIGDGLRDALDPRSSRR